MFDTKGGLITVDALRSEIGSPTADPREDGAITDQELGRLIERHRKSLDRSILHRLEKRVMGEGQKAGFEGIFERTNVLDLSPDGEYARGYIEEEYYPVTRRAATDGTNWFVYDENLETQAIGHFDRHRYKLVGKEVLVIPKDVTALKIALPHKARTRETLGGDIIERINGQIKEEAAAMLKAKISEGQRLSQSSDPDY